MEKPKPRQESPVMDYTEMIEYIERKYDINARDYSKKYETQGKIIKLYNNAVSEELKIKRSTKFSSDIYKTFEKWLTANNLPSIQNDDIPYLDYWHWLIDNDFCGIHNGERAYWGLQEILGNEEAPDWVKEITQKVKDEFSEHIDEEGGLEVSVSW